jgi:tetratricopeptide (TPR) repeat protein
LELNKKKKHQTRLKYIQAQIYQKTEKLNKAAKLYLQVVKMNPEYDMAFHAKINMARCFEANAKDSKEIKKELYKMIKDSKNKDYLDEIYFVLAEIALKENKEEKAIDYLKLSAQKSVSNNRQKGISYYTLGEIYYAHLNYEYAEMYYDSCVQFLPQEFENYDQIKNKQEVLSSLVKNIKIIELEDSLQYLATC